jgi:hypothetical protein
MDRVDLAGVRRLQRAPGAADEFLYRCCRVGAANQSVWLGHHSPRKGPRWIGDLLARLSLQDIGDAFRAGGYSADEIEQLSRVVEGRIGELEKL